jgi:aminoglycoside phosphotransferase family enzyme/predicted kinase
MATSGKAIGSDAVLEFLSRPSSYPDKPSSVEVVETHISWVFLTDRYAYKLKKPVKFDFVDFSTPTLRHRYCEDELRLNRRLAPDVYVDVLPVTGDAHGELELAGDGDVVDWVVQMKRLPADKAVDVLLRTQRLSLNDAAIIAQHLAKFYAGLPPASLTAEEFRGVFDRHVRANGDALLDALPDSEKARIERIQGAQLLFLNVCADVFDRRVDSGRIVDGHGDLRPEHIYLTTPLAIIDCIEFSAALRRVDIADELSFLAMECDRLGDCSLGEQVLSNYQQYCHDEIPRTLLAFYRCYRACVRAKIAAIRARQEPEEKRRPFTRLAHQYLNWADHYVSEIGRPSLIVVGGLMGAGKSALAAELADTFGAGLRSTDHIRQSLLGPSRSAAAFAEGNYEPQMRDRVYQELICQASELICKGRSVILDGTFLTRKRRDQAYDLGNRHNVSTVVVLCNCPRDVAISRVQERARIGRSESEARAELYDQQSVEFQQLDANEPSVSVDTTLPVSNQLQLVCDRLRRSMRV